MQKENFSKEQLFILNKLVQALPLEKRSAYLEKLGDFWIYLQGSEDYLIDERDYNIYSVISIGKQYWLGENLRYEGVKHQKNPNNPNLLYGCLYDWDTAMGELLPKGWHIPSDEEWKVLEEHLGMFELELHQKGYNRNVVGGILKSSKGWKSGGPLYEKGIFQAYPVGGYWMDDFRCLGTDAYFWTSTASSEDYAWYRGLSYEDDQISRMDYAKSYGRSCRCIRED